MIDLCISGVLDRDIMVFSLDGETKTIDQFSKEIHFSLEEKRQHRIHFEQKNEHYIPRWAEIALSIVFLPIRGIINTITFNSDQNWEKNISAFKITGYIDINLQEDTKISFKLIHGNFDKTTSTLKKPTLSFSPDVLSEQSLISDSKGISKNHVNYLFNIASVSMFLYALLIYLLFVGFKNGITIACIFIPFLLVAFSILVIFLVLRSFKIKNKLLMTLKNQRHKEND